MTNGLTTLVKLKGTLGSPNGKTVEMKNLILSLIPRKNRETSDEVRKYQYGDNRSLHQI